MPVTVKKLGGKWRVVEEASGRIATTHKGNPVDGGGHAAIGRANRQATAINTNLAKRKQK